MLMMIILVGALVQPKKAGTSRLLIRSLPNRPKLVPLNRQPKRENPNLI